MTQGLFSCLPDDLELRENESDSCARYFRGADWEI